MQIFDVTAGRGRLGITWMPGRGADLATDIETIRLWGAGMVITMVPDHELARCGAHALPHELAASKIAWEHVPVADFGAPTGAALARWPSVSAAAHALLDGGGRVLTHCFGGCGRSGMAALRLLAERGEHPRAALDRLRAVRPCAVESPGQFEWARQGQSASIAD